MRLLEAAGSQRSASRRGLITIIGGAALGQLVGLLGAPVLSRLGTLVVAEAMVLSTNSGVSLSIEVAHARSDSLGQKLGDQVQHFKANGAPGIPPECPISSSHAWRCGCNV